MNKIVEGRVYSRQSAADCIGVNPRTIDRWLAAGILKSSRLGGRRVILGEHIREAIRKGEAG